MYIAITPQKTGKTYQNSVKEFVDYLEKENKEPLKTKEEHFFNQYRDTISGKEVQNEIDQNIAKLKKKDPKFYSLIVSPSKSELIHIQNNPQALKTYTRELMKDYASSFHRDRPVTQHDLLYFAKIEHTRTYRGFEKEILENKPYSQQIARLENTIRKVARGEQQGNITKLQQEIQDLKTQAPHTREGELLKTGMQKEGLQTHVHIIVSRKDATNTYSLSPGAKHKASEVTLNGKTVKRGFDRSGFFQKAEQSFDRLFGYTRNYAASYKGRNEHHKNPFQFYARLAGLPTTEKAATFKILSKSGIALPIIPTNQSQVAIKTLKALKRGIQVAIRSGGIEI